MFNNKLKERLAQGETLLGLCNMYPSSGIIEGICKGWDFVWMDGQHGQHSYESLLHGVQTASSLGLETVIRVPGHEYAFLGMYADLAPSAVMVPMINNSDEAVKVAKGLRFPPLGERSYGGRRIIDLYGRDYYREAELLVIAQIETLEAVENVCDISAIKGIDMLFFGPDDMKVRMGIPINTKISESQELREAMRKVGEAGRKAQKYCGCVVQSREDMQMAIEIGYSLFVCGADIGFMRTASAEKLKEMKQGLITGKVEASFYG